MSKRSISPDSAVSPSKLPTLPLPELPLEIWTMIYAFLSHRDRCNLRLVSSQWSALVSTTFHCLTRPDIGHGRSALKGISAFSRLREISMTISDTKGDEDWVKDVCQKAGMLFGSKMTLILHPEDGRCPIWLLHTNVSGCSVVLHYTAHRVGFYRPALYFPYNCTKFQVLATNSHAFVFNTEAFPKELVLSQGWLCSQQAFQAISKCQRIEAAVYFNFETSFKWNDTTEWTCQHFMVLYRGLEFMPYSDKIYPDVSVEELLESLCECVASGHWRQRELSIETNIAFEKVHINLYHRCKVLDEELNAKNLGIVRVYFPSHTSTPTYSHEYGHVFVYV